MWKTSLKEQGCLFIRPKLTAAFIAEVTPTLLTLIVYTEHPMFTLLVPWSDTNHAFIKQAIVLSKNLKIVDVPTVNDWKHKTKKAKQFALAHKIPLDNLGTFSQANKTTLWMHGLQWSPKKPNALPQQPKELKPNKEQKPKQAKQPNNKEVQPYKEKQRYKEGKEKRQTKRHKSKQQAKRATLKCPPHMQRNPMTNRCTYKNKCGYGYVRGANGECKHTKKQKRDANNNNNHGWMLDQPLEWVPSYSPHEQMASSSSSSILKEPKMDVSLLSSAVIDKKSVSSKPESKDKQPIMTKEPKVLVTQPPSTTNKERENKQEEEQEQEAVAPPPMVNVDKKTTLYPRAPSSYTSIVVPHTMDHQINIKQFGQADVEKAKRSGLWDQMIQRLRSAKHEINHATGRMIQAGSFTDQVVQQMNAENPRQQLFAEGIAIVTVNEFRTLLPGLWIDDQIINAYCLLLQRQFARSMVAFPCQMILMFLESMHAGQTAQQAFTTVNETYHLMGMGISRHQQFWLFPVFQHNHWFLVAITNERGGRSTLASLDSMRSSCHDTTLRDITTFYELMCQTILHEPSPARLHINERLCSSMSHQTNGYDCGVYTLMAALFLCCNIPVNQIHAKNTVYYRLHIAETIHTHHLQITI